MSLEKEEEAFVLEKRDWACRLYESEANRGPCSQYVPVECAGSFFLLCFFFVVNCAHVLQASLLVRILVLVAKSRNAWLRQCWLLHSYRGLTWSW